MTAAVGSWAPVAVDLECQGSGRVAACDFVRSALDDIEVVAVVPRARADVVLYLDVTERQNDDLWLLRATSGLEGAPQTYEQVATVDYRLPVDEQEVRFDAPLSRVLAPFVGACLPGAVDVRLSAPGGVEEEARRTTPYGLEAKVGGMGSWTEKYQSASVWGGLTLQRVTLGDRAALELDYQRDVERQPDLEVDGLSVPLAYDSEEIGGVLSASRNLDDHWTLGLVGRAGHQDDDGQFQATTRVHAGVERNWFRSDDSRGNRLSAAYLVGFQDDVYYRRNALGETAAAFPTHLLLLDGDVRFDTVELEVELAVEAELLHPDRRYVLSAETETELNLGSHLDLELNLGVTQQAIPGPADVDEGDFEQVKRASYAQPLQMSGDLELRVHFDPTNGARNNRFEAPSDLDPTDNL